MVSSRCLIVYILHGGRAPSHVAEMTACATHAPRPIYTGRLKPSRNATSLTPSKVTQSSLRTTTLYMRPMQRNHLRMPSRKLTRLSRFADPRKTDRPESAKGYNCSSRQSEQGGKRGRARRGRRIFQEKIGGCAPRVLGMYPFI